MAFGATFVLARACLGHDYGSKSRKQILNSNFGQTCSIPGETSRTTSYIVGDRNASGRGDIFDVSRVYGRRQKLGWLWLFGWLNCGIFNRFHRTWMGTIFDTNSERPMFRYTFSEIMDTCRRTLTFRRLQWVRSYFGQSDRRNWGGQYCASSCAWLCPKMVPVYQYVSIAHSVFSLIWTSFELVTTYVSHRNFK